MSDKDVRLLEQNVKHNMEDIRELKKRVGSVEESVSDLKTNQQITNQSVSHVMEMLSELKVSFQTLDDKMDKDREEQLKAYKKATWQVAIAIIVAIFLIQLGLN